MRKRRGKVASIPRGRRTITIDTDLEKKLRDIQAQMIMTTNKNWSLSAILNVVILAGIIGSSGLGRNEWKIIRSFLKKIKPNLQRYASAEYVENLK